MNFETSRTKQNLMAAFSGESMARNKYLFFADKARKEGHDEVADLFEAMAKNEGVHGRLFYEKAVGIGSSNANLQEAIRGEYGEWSSMYPDFAKQAREEGYDDIAELFEGVAKVEKNHEYQFMATLAQLQSGRQRLPRPPLHRPPPQPNRLPSRSRQRVTAVCSAALSTISALMCAASATPLALLNRLLIRSGPKRSQAKPEVFWPSGLHVRVAAPSKSWFILFSCGVSRERTAPGYAWSSPFSL